MTSLACSGKSTSQIQTCVLKMLHQGQCNDDLCSWFRWPPNQTKPNNAYLPQHDIPFWKCQTKENRMLTSAADLGDNKTWQNNIYLPLHDIPFRKHQIKDNEMVHPPTQKSYSTHQLLKTNSVLTQISYISKMLYHVGLNVDCLVWFAGLPN